MEAVSPNKEFVFLAIQSWDLPHSAIEQRKLTVFIGV